MQKNISQIILGIIGVEMTLPSNNLWVRDQPRKVPNDMGIYVVAGMVSSQLIAAESYITTTAELWDQQPDFWDQPNDPHWDQGITGQTSEVLMKEMIQIDFFSRSNDGFLRNWEVVAALRSIEAQQKQEEYNFRINRPVSFFNTSPAEGGSMLNRYSLTVPCFVWYRKAKTLSDTGGDFYTEFRTRVDTEKTIGKPHGLIEFEIL